MIVMLPCIPNEPRRWLLARAFLHLLGEPLDRLPHGLGVLLRCDPGLLSLFLGLGQHVFGSVGSFGTRVIDMLCRPVGWAGLVDHDFSGAVRLNLDLYPDLDRFLRVCPRGRTRRRICRCGDRRRTRHRARDHEQNVHGRSPADGLRTCGFSTLQFANMAASHRRVQRG
jgi:hypothetical protein